MTNLDYCPPCLRVIYEMVPQELCTSAGNKTETIVYSDEEFDF